MSLTWSVPEALAPNQRGIHDNPRAVKLAALRFGHSVPSLRSVVKHKTANVQGCDIISAAVRLDDDFDILIERHKKAEQADKPLSVD